MSSAPKPVRTGGGQHFDIARTVDDLEKAYKRLSKSIYIGVDSETGGLDPHSKPLWSVQFSNGEYSVLVPYNHLQTLGPFGKLLADKKYVKIFQQAKFDIKFLLKHGYDVNNVFDTKIAEQLLTAGKHADISLKGVAKKYLKYEMSKEERSTFYDGTFETEQDFRGELDVWLKNPDLIDYALDDVWVLPAIMHEQWARIVEQEMERVARLEMELVPVVAKMEYLGVAVHPERVTEVGDKFQAKADKLRTQLDETFEPLWQQHWRPQYQEDMLLWNQWKVPYQKLKQKATIKAFDDWWKKHQKPAWDRLLSQKASKEQKTQYRKERDEHYETEKQEWLDGHRPALLELKEKKPFSSPPKERGAFNVNSWQQVIASLEQVGVNLPDTKKVTLEEFAGQNEVLDLLLDYRKYEKLSKYRTLLLDGLNPATNRVHPDINQIVSTGRFSISNPPLQQIPVKTDEGKELRACFVAPPGRSIVAADYTAIELVEVGAFSGDKNLMESIRRQSDESFDPHTYTISIFLQTPYEELMLAKKGQDVTAKVREGRQRFEELVHIPELVAVAWDTAGFKSWMSKLRDITKTITYGLVYGMGPKNLSIKFHMSMEAAEKFIALFFAAYPEVESYIVTTGEFGLANGYSVTPYGRRRNYNLPKEPTRQDAYKAVLEDLAEEEINWRDLTDYEQKRLISRKLWKLENSVHWVRESIKRQSGNHPIQGGSADMTKLAMVKFAQLHAEAGLPFEDFLRLTVHDELLAECSNENAETCQKLLAEAMVWGAYQILPSDIPVRAEAKISSHWDK